MDEVAYPLPGTPNRAGQIAVLEEFQMYRPPEIPVMQTVEAYQAQVAQMCTGFEKYTYQHLMEHYLSRRTPFRGLLLYHALGTGKCHAKDTPILMYDGTIKMVQDVRIGDLLMGDDSTPRRVLSLASGIDDLYDVIPKKGDKYTVNSEHILCLRSQGDRDTVIQMEARDFVALPEPRRAELQGYRVGVEFPEQAVPSDPYEIGQVPDEIPRAYLINSRAHRLRLLAGIIDAAGRVNLADGYVAVGPLVSANDVQFLARSLGLAADRDGQTVLISGDLSEVPVLCHRLPEKTDALVVGIDVKPAGRGRYYGFTIDGNNRYLLGDFTVTHNTCTAITISEALLSDHRQEDDPPIWVILPKTLIRSFQDQIFSVAAAMDPARLAEQCTGDTYMRIMKARGDRGGPMKAKDRELFARRITQVIEKRYRFFTYDEFAKYIEGKSDAELQKMGPRTIIVDEAHNLRVAENDKRAAAALWRFLGTSAPNRNRLVLMSATPMYNESKEIWFLMALLMQNEGRLGAGPLADALARFPMLYNADGVPNADAHALLAGLSSDYVSFLRGTNPLTFAKRLSPDVNGKGYEVERGFQAIRDGIVASRLGRLQIGVIQGGGASPAASASASASPSPAASASSSGPEEAYEDLGPNEERVDEQFMQKFNIVYPQGQIGQTGFWKTFQNEKQQDPMVLRYHPDANGYLVPNGNLGKAAAKMQRICDLVRKSEGVVVIFSRFLWSGVVPLAIALEHMGFERFGSGNLLGKQAYDEHASVAKRATFTGIQFPKYAILTNEGDSRIMGKTRIHKLVREIQAPGNLRGERIKVILMTGVASEGLSFRNVREVHILEPWYHMHRIDQVVGRSLRTCSHTDLPLEERNVTVFLHAAYADPKALSKAAGAGAPIGPAEADLHAYSITNRKAMQVREVARILQANAWDCPILDRLNHFPESMFPEPFRMRTSQGVEIRAQLGDDPEDAAPACTAMPADVPAVPLDRAVLGFLVPTVQQRLRRYLSGQQPGYFRTSDLVAVLKMPEPVVMEALVRSGLRRHRDGIIWPGTEQPPRDIVRLRLRPQEKQASATATATANATAPAPAPAPAPLVAIGRTIEETVLNFYLSIDSSSLPIQAKAMITGTAQAQPPQVVDALAAIGFFIRREEVSNPRGLIAGQPFVGYVDPFSPSTLKYPAELPDMRVMLFDSNQNARPATSAELLAIKSRREAIRLPARAGAMAKQRTGWLQPYRSRKAEQTNPYTLQVKIREGEAGAKSSGTICTSLSQENILQGLQELGISPAKNAKGGALSRRALCNQLALGLIQEGRFYMAPGYRPKKEGVI